MTREDLVGTYACKICGSLKKTPASRCYYCKPDNGDEPERVRTYNTAPITNVRRDGSAVAPGVVKLQNGSWSCIHGRQKSKCKEGCNELSAQQYQEQQTSHMAQGPSGEDMHMGVQNLVETVISEPIMLEEKNSSAEM